MAEHDLGKLAWRKASACKDNSCVEVAATGKDVLVRDSNDREGKVLVIPLRKWEAFLLGLGDDETVRSSADDNVPW